MSEQLSLPKQTVNSALKKLVEEGVLRLEAADGNLKNKRVCLTEAGEAFLRRTVDRVFGVESAAAARLTEEERSALGGIEPEAAGCLSGGDGSFFTDRCDRRLMYADQTF